jgi:glycosyltransferase involved in cell wall biosynthesis
MKVLNINKFYYYKGGSETYFFSLSELLEQNGIEVIPFSLKDKKNIETKYDRFFLNPIDYTNPSFKQKIVYAGKIIYSWEARRKLTELLSHVKPDIAHLHIFQHQISPSILSVLKNQSIPVVYTAHDLKVLCPNYKMLSKKVVCEKCKNHKYINCFLNKCVKESKLGSLVNTIEMYVHHWLQSYEKYVDVIITPSRFFQQKFIEYGFSPQKVRYVPNFLDTQKFKPQYTYKNYFIFMGRLSEEKGILTLLEAMKFVRKSKLIIVGIGPLEEQVKREIKNRFLDNVESVGFKTGAELEEIAQYCQFLVMPSLCYENSPYSVLEANAYGKPVIGANIGGIPELIDDKKSGLLFKPGDADDLAEKLNFMLENPNNISMMGTAARNRIEKCHDKEGHFHQIMSVYQELLDRNNSDTK